MVTFDVLVVRALLLVAILLLSILAFGLELSARQQALALVACVVLPVLPAMLGLED